jgi:regulator of protease activity HflC (stomatin/prohibitin superfamily)
MKALWTVLAVLLVLAALCLSSALFTVDEPEQAVITRFGRDRVVLVEPGIHMKAPFADRQGCSIRNPEMGQRTPGYLHQGRHPLRVEATAGGGFRTR